MHVFYVIIVSHRKYIEKKKMKVWIKRIGGFCNPINKNVILNAVKNLIML